MINTPAIRTLSNFFPAVITQEMQSMDGLNGYGARKEWYVEIYIVTDRCQLCGAISHTVEYDPFPVLSGKCEHKWRSGKERVAYARAKSKADALAEANQQASGFLAQVVNANPEYRKKFLSYLMESYEPEN